MAKEFKEPKYDIEKTSYRYKKTDDVDESGRPVFVKIGESKTSVLKDVKNFKELKSKLKKQQDKDKTLKVHYEKSNTFTCSKDKFGRVSKIKRNPARIKNTVKNNGNNEYTVTYFNVKK